MANKTPDPLGGVEEALLSDSVISLEPVPTSLRNISSSLAIPKEKAAVVPP